MVSRKSLDFYEVSIRLLVAVQLAARELVTALEINIDMIWCDVHRGTFCTRTGPQRLYLEIINLLDIQRSGDGR